MPQKETKFRSLFAGLGKATLRGIRKCPKCGTVNGTRGSACKNKNCDVVFGRKERRDVVVLEASELYSLPGFVEEVFFSVRCKDRGKDYRNFVKRTRLKKEQSSTGPSSGTFKCLFDGCVKQPEQLCTHISTAQKCSQRAQLLPVKDTAMARLNIPSRYVEVLTKSIQDSSLSVQRVSDATFVVLLGEQNNEGIRKLDITHTIFTKSKGEMVSERAFYCSCSILKIREEGVHTTGCLHFWCCIFAFHSNGLTEFDQFIPYTAQEVSAPLLSQLHFISNDGKSVELDSSLTVEIMRDNLALLGMSEDDASLANVQTFEGVLSDPIIVASVEEALTFGDSATVLEGLDEEHQVCHIFSNSQGNTIHLSYQNQSQLSQEHLVATSFEPGQNDSSQVLIGSSSPNGDDNSIENKEIVVEESVATSAPPPVKRRKGHGETNQIVNVLYRPINHSKEVVVGTKEPPTATEDENHRMNSGFELWLAGLNDRINATMNYQLTAEPEPLIYYIPTDYFECMRERLTPYVTLVGGRKKRLPNQTIVFQRTDKAPVGSFTKFIWKITNIHHVMKVFESSMIPLKPKQYFLKSANGNYVEWVPPLETIEKKETQRILPVLHSTQLKCGKNFPSANKESTPFTIEWVPEMLRVSKLGELLIQFQFHKSEPHKEEGREVSS